VIERVWQQGELSAVADDGWINEIS